MLNPKCLWANAHVLDLRWSMCVYDPADDVFVSKFIVRTGAWEKGLVEGMLRAMRAHPGSVLLDVGGNIGYYTLAAARAGFRVHAFEPVPQNAMRIEASVAKNSLSNATLYTAALGRETGVVLMGRSAKNQGGVSHKKQLRQGSNPIALPVLRLDDILPSETAPLYIKIDIEGGECDAFAGMRSYLEGAKRIIGVNMEFGQSRERCCHEWTVPGGAFDVFHSRHALCPRGVEYANVCESKRWELVWSPCA